MAKKQQALSLETKQSIVKDVESDTSVAAKYNVADTTDYFIAEASEDQLFACVMHGNFSHLYISDQRGLRFSLSLENVLYLKTDEARETRRAFGGGRREEALLDLHRVQGVRGVYIATRVKSPHRPSELESQVSVISFDNGGSWQPLVPPSVHHDGTPVHCDPGQGCSLHLSQKFGLLYGGTRSPTIFSKESAVLGRDVCHRASPPPGYTLARNVTGSEAPPSRVASWVKEGYNADL
ncbi:hypothetical protein HPB47_000345 [Ixodes persulcatus]|uniref:Uncharacterized protein n=1 Tax=Ixodes persulcatus TaxID=34615 RepID=A0AC60PS14_IXOPE|nr:hypothetical protein HPB47_000345 [Ixodes persulcatus]